MESFKLWISKQFQAIKIFKKSKSPVLFMFLLFLTLAFSFENCAPTFKKTQLAQTSLLPTMSYSQIGQITPSGLLISATISPTNDVYKDFILHCETLEVFEDSVSEANLVACGVSSGTFGTNSLITKYASDVEASTDKLAVSAHMQGTTSLLVLKLNPDGSAHVVRTNLEFITAYGGITSYPLAYFYITTIKQFEVAPYAVGEAVSTTLTSGPLNAKSFGPWVFSHYRDSGCVGNNNIYDLSVAGATGAVSTTITGHSGSICVE